MAKAKKRIFMGLLLGLELVIAVGLFLMWYLPYEGFQTLGSNLPVILGWFFIGLLSLFSLGIILIVLTIIRGRVMPGTRWLRGILIRYMLPVITGVGRLFGISKDDIRRSFVEINNELVRSETRKAPPKRILILMPHCIQKNVCPYRITVDVQNCRHCGKCDFSELTLIAERMGVQMTVATGGSLARRVVIEARPQLIVGVACERDLSSGIADTYPIPVIGVLLDRPEGPCINTRVSVEKVREALDHFLEEDPILSEIETGQNTIS